MGGRQLVNRRGFTIVELLIVIVVIAVLAAITIVAYNGIQNRAKAGAAQSAASQAAKKVLSYAVLNSDAYPADLSTAGVSASGSTTFQYAVNNTTPRSFCVTATTSNVSYYVSSSQTSPTVGGCAGHGVNGVTALTNYFHNPTYSGPSVPANQSQTTASIATCNGSLAARAITTSTADASMRLQPADDRWPVTVGQQVYASALIHNASASLSLSFAMSARFYDTAGATLGTQLQISSSPTLLLAPLQTQLFTVGPVTAPAGAASVGLNANRVSGGSATATDTYCADNVMLTTETANFADGMSSNWVWNGTVNDSTSTGPPL